MSGFVVRFVREEEGQDLIEYALLAAFISLAAIVALGQLGTAINNVYTRVSTTLDSAS
jgi:pilus assembly protein Flp/PilA